MVSHDTILLFYYNDGYDEYQTLDTINAYTYKYVTKYRRPLNRPLKFIVKPEGLYEINSEGELITTRFTLTEEKRYFLQKTDLKMKWWRNPRFDIYKIRD